MKKQTKELALIERIETKLQTPNVINVFPLTPTHRKELRVLRSRNLGDLKTQLRFIKEEKRNEYIAKYKDRILKENSKRIQIGTKLNQDWKNRIDKINLIIKERLDLETKHNSILKNLELNYRNDYVSNLELLDCEEQKRKYETSDISFVKAIAKEEFIEKYGKMFDFVDNKITDLYNKYEEAINFGDLNLVKELYYYMKSSDQLFEKIRGIQV